VDNNSRAETNLAVLIDFENIAAGTEKEGLGRFDVETLMKRLKDKGRILIARSYADWGRFYRFKQTLLAENVTMMELTSHGQQDKNRADIALVVDALELAFTKDYIDAFVIVSGDSDFTPMVLKMRELNKRVIGVGTRKSTSRLLFQACDEFLYYDTIVQPKTRPAAVSRAKRSASGELAKAFELLADALEGLQREIPDPPHGSLVKSAMIRKSPIFSESELGFPTFAKFLETAQDHGVVRLVRDTKSGGYRVDAPNDESRAAQTAANVEDDEPSAELGSAPAASFADHYLPAGVGPWVDVLTTAGFHPLSAPTRLAILEALVDVVRERGDRRRKNTLPFVRDDMKKKLRRLDLPADQIKNVLDTLLAAGELMHRDGTAIRSGTAAFTLTKDATQLNDGLVRFYLAHLREAGSDLSDTGRLAELFLGNVDRRREIETTLAYLTADDGRSDDRELDLDDLLTVGGGGGGQPAQASLPDDLDAVLEFVGEPAPRERERAPRDTAPAPRERERAPAPAPRERPAPAELPLDLDAVLESSGEPRMSVTDPESATEPKKRKRTRTKADAKPEGEKEPKETKAAKEPAAKKASTKREKTAPKEDFLDLDSLLEPQPPAEADE
jgi:uncharacterized LabA/DUF88 family protein